MGQQWTSWSLLRTPRCPPPPPLQQLFRFWQKEDGAQQDYGFPQIDLLLQSLPKSSMESLRDPCGT